MSYTNQVKEEVLKKEITSPLEKFLEIYSFLKGKKAIFDDRIELKLENKDIAERVYKFLKEITQLKIFIKYSVSMRLGEHNVYTIMIPNQKGYINFMKRIEGYDNLELGNYDEKFKGFLRGLFLSCGYIKSPEKEYAMDFFIDSEEIGEKLYKTLKIKGKRVFKTKKRNKALVYLRNSEDIMDILVNIGAITEFFKYEEVTMMRDLKNKTIREINWEIANETKTLDTGKKQIKMIKYIGKKIGLNNLSGVLEEIAFLRLQNPESSLTELADMVGISKSGIRNRFRRIEKVYIELIEKEKLGEKIE
jgi:DNA-binding protein WhiA